jgi:hypothetical protein
MIKKTREKKPRCTVSFNVRANFLNNGVFVYGRRLAFIPNFNFLRVAIRADGIYKEFGCTFVVPFEAGECMKLTNSNISQSFF